MAASTSAPMAMAMPESDMMFEVSPLAYMGMNEMITATGIVTMGMAALGRCRRKSRMTRLTMISSSTSVRTRVRIERWISSERS